MFLLLAFLFSFYLVSSSVLALKGKNSQESYGVVLLDSFTFPKIAPSDRYNTVVLFCQKTDIGKFATDDIRDNYLPIALNAESDESTLLFAQVIVNGAQNLDIAEKYGVVKFPKILLFKMNSTDPIDFPSNITPNSVNIRRFVSMYTGIPYPTPGSIRLLDQLSIRFLKATSNEERQSVLEQAKLVAQNSDIVDTDEKKVAAKYYIKIMEKVLEKGASYIKEELLRLAAITESDKVSENKKEELRKKISIAHQFDYEIPIFEGTLQQEL